MGTRGLAHAYDCLFRDSTEPCRAAPRLQATSPPACRMHGNIEIWSKAFDGAVTAVRPIQTYYSTMVEPAVEFLRLASWC